MDKETCVLTRTALVAVAAKPRPPTPAGITAEVLPDRGGLRVLIADDDADTADSLAILLSFWGHEVCVARTGAEALGMAFVLRPDVLLLDVAMPGVDGFSLARAIRQHPFLHGVLLVAVTGYADEAHCQLGLRAGFDHYLAKPVEPKFIQALLALEAGVRGVVASSRNPLSCSPRGGLSHV
jgi:CheY-like chemotaxis protein